MRDNPLPSIDRDPPNEELRRRGFASREERGEPQRHGGTEAEIHYPAPHQSMLLELGFPWNRSSVVPASVPLCLCGSPCPSLHASRITRHVFP